MLHQQTLRLFSEFFGKKAEALFQAPGRVNLVGEHTDYNNGFVLPCAIDRVVYMAISGRQDNVFKVVAVNNNNELSSWKSSLPLNKDSKYHWADYLRGVNEQFLKQNLSPQGMDVLVSGNIPLDAGLSSSAALCVVFATAINRLNQFVLSETEIALLCQAAENEFVGCNCGIMDQLVSVAGRRDHALLIDCKNLTSQPIRMPDDMQVIIIDSRVKRSLVGSKYNKRRLECEEAASIMAVDSLREVSYSRLLESKNLMEDVIFRRARHVVTENERTQLAAEALGNSDYASLSELMSASHESMRYDFEITTSEIDYLVEIVSNVLRDAGGVRMTGGGFGGCVIALTHQDQNQMVIETVTGLYAGKTGLDVKIHLCVAGDGAGRVPMHPQRAPKNIPVR